MTPMKTIAIAAVSLSIGGAGAAYALSPAPMPAGVTDAAQVAVPVHFDGPRGPGGREGREGRRGRGGPGGWHRGPEGRGGPGGPGGMRHGRGGPGGMGMMMVLRLADTDENGSLSQEEVDAFVAGQVTEANADGTDGVTLEEFQTIWLSMTQPMMVRTFQFFDTDGDAVISQEEIDARFGDVVAKLDRNDDGKLDRGDHRGGRKHHRGHRGGRGGDRDGGGRDDN